jgi:hypothetical protein
MSTIKIKLSGVAAEITLGSYMPADTTIFNNWEEFYHYNDLVHESQLLADYISEIQISEDDQVIFTGKIAASQLKPQKSYSPVLKDKALYLRTECAEQAVYQCEIELADFDKTKLSFETQDYDLLFKVGNSFLAKIMYNDMALPLEWVSGKPVGNICVLCKFENGFLIPVYDAVNKLTVLK